MSAHGGKRKITQRVFKAVSNRALALAGEPEGMSVQITGSMSASSPMPIPTDSPQTNGNSTVPAHLSKALSPATSSSSHNGGSSSTSSRPTTEAVSVEGPFEVDFTVTVKGFGHYALQEQRLALTLARALHASFGKGSYVLTDEIGDEITFDPKGADGGMVRNTKTGLSYPPSA